MIELALAQQDGRELLETLAQVTLELPGSDKRLVPGTRSHEQARSLVGLWEPLAAALRSLEETGQDVVVDWEARPGMGEIGADGRAAGAFDLDGDLAIGRMAAETAAMASPFEEIPRLDLAAGASAEGRHAEARRIVRDEIANRTDDEGAPPELVERTREILQARADWLVGRTTQCVS